MEKFKTDISEFTAEEMIKGQKEMVASLYTQPLLFQEGPVIHAITSVKRSRMMSRSEQDIRSRKAYELLHTKETARFYLQAGQNFGILCRRFEGWYIKSIISYLKLTGIDAEYEKMHEKGLGFTGYIIKRKVS